jgi:signal transduction histidine kinase
MNTGRTADTSIRARIWRLAVLDCALMLLLGMALAWSLQRSRAADAQVQHTEAVLRDLRNYSGEMVQAETSQRGFLLTGQDEYLAPYDAVVTNNQAQLQALITVIDDPARQDQLQTLGLIMGLKLRELGLTIQMAKSGNLSGALAEVKEGRGRRYMIDFQNISTALADSESASLAEGEAAADAQSREIMTFLAIGGLAVIALVAGIAAHTIAQIDGPLAGLMEGIGAFGAGQRERRVHIKSRDEIGQVADAFNRMADDLVEAAAAQQRSTTALARSNTNLTAEIGDRRAAEASLGRSIAELDDRIAAQARLSRLIADLERSNGELDNFAYGASHDLKAPLRGIRNLTEWITADVKDTASEDTLENLMMLHNRVERLDLLLDSLLEYSRIGRTGGAPETIDSAKMVADIAEYIAPRPGFTIACQGPLPAMHTHKASLEQVLRNLIGNGLKHHDRDSGTVTVSARDMGEMVEFRVEDDGPGVPKAFHERIFQMFQTLKSRDEIEGSGMGLAIVRKSVEVHAGRIRVESAPPGRGTAFVFTWEKTTRAA